MRKSISFIAFLFLIPLGSATDWNVAVSPETPQVTGSTVQIVFRLNPSLGSGILENVAGISGDIAYDAAVFSNPQIEPGIQLKNNPSLFGQLKGYQVSGVMIEPGRFRFCITCSPIERIYIGYTDLAYFTFVIDDMAALAASPKTFTLENGSASNRTRDIYTGVTFQPITIKNYASDWLWSLGESRGRLPHL